MIEKISKLFGSIRFWQVTLASASGFVAWVQTHGFEFGALFAAVSAWLTVIVTIGTIDSAAVKSSGTVLTKENTPPNP